MLLSIALFFMCINNFERRRMEVDARAGRGVMAFMLYTKYMGVLIISVHVEPRT